jgi:uncharacterized protein (DUF697 family)
MMKENIVDKILKIYGVDTDYQLAKVVTPRVTKQAVSLWRVNNKVSRRFARIIYKKSKGALKFPELMGLTNENK